MPTKSQILTAIREEYNRWEATLVSLNEAQITAPELPEGWSIKDVIAHLHAWQQRSIARLEAAQSGEEPTYPAWPTQLNPEAEGEPNDLNAWLYQQSRDKSWSSVYRNWRAGFLRLLELGEATDEKDLFDTGKYPWLDGYALIEVLEGTYEHHHEHAEYLEPLLAKFRQSAT